MRLFKRNNKNVDKTIQLTLILLLMMLAAAWLFRVFSVLEVWQQVFAAVLSVTITAVVTKVLLKGQTKAEEIKEREGTIFEEKQKIFKSFLSKMENIVMDEKIERHEIKELIFQISSLSMHTSDERINDILLRLTDCVKCLPYGQDEEMSHIQTKRFAKNVLRLTRALKAELYMSDALDRDNDKLSYRAFGDLINEAQSRDGEELGYPLTFDIMLLFWYSIVEQLKRWGMKFTRRDRDFDQWSTYEDIYADIEYYFSHNKFQREACNFGFNILLPTIPNLNVVYRIELSNNNIAMGFSWVHPHQGPLNEFEIQFLEVMSNCPGGSGSMATNQEWAAYEPMAPLRNLNFQRDMLGFDGDKPIDTSSNIYDFVNVYRRKQFITEFLSIIYMQIGTYIRFIDQHRPAKNKRWNNWFKSPGTKEEQLSAQNYYNVVKARALLQTALEIKAAKDIIEKDKDKYEKNPTADNKEDYDFTVACTEEYISKFGFTSLEEAQEAVEPILDECQQLFKSQCQENDGESLYLYFSFLFHNPTYEDEPTMYGLLRRSAIMGFRYAQLDLGIYEKDVDNTMESLKWLQLASSQDMPEALSVLGDYYNDANSDNYDDTLALIYYRKAAKIYDPVALYNIGLYYETDEEEKNIQKAIAYYKKSSLQCCVSASLKLSELYAKGIGVQKDLHKSFEILMSMITFPEENFQNGELNKYRVRVAAYALCGYEVDNIYTPRQLLDLVEKDGALYDKDYYYYLQVMEEDEIEPLIDKIQKKFKQYDYYKLAFEFCLEDELHPFTNYDFAENLLKEGFDLYEQDIQENKYFEPIILSLQGLIAIAREDKEDVMGIWEEYSQRKLVPDLYIFNEMCDLFELRIQPFLEQNQLQPRHKSRNSNKLK